VHFINRTADERYVAIHDGSLRVFNLETGVEASITGTSTYINSSTPKDDLEFFTVADYTFILNKTKTVAASSATTSAISSRPYVFIKQGGYATEYFIKADGTTYNVRTGDSGETSDIFPDRSAKAGFARNLFFQSSVITGANDVANMSAIATQKGTTGIYFNGSVNTISVGSDLNEDGIGLLNESVNSISDLPLYCINGYKIKVIGDTELNEDDYYVKFETADGGLSGNGSWVETSGDSVSQGLDGSTMPHQLVNTGLNTFAIQTGSFKSREAGDDDTNPHPSFVGKKISSIFFFKNRLGYTVDDNVVMSVAGEFFDHYRATVTTLLDDGPIDVSISSTRVTRLKHGVGFQGDLILFSDNSQFVMKSGELLTPKTVSISAATSFNADTAVAPLALGSYIYFPFRRGVYTGLNEFATNVNTDTFDSAEVTEHVPSYIPSDLTHLVGSTSEEAIVAVSVNDRSALYIYNYFWNNNQKVLSAWSKFTVDGEIAGVDFIDSSLYIVLTKNSETHLLELPMASGIVDPSGYTTHLDMRVAMTVTEGDTTLPPLPYTPDDNTIQVYTDDGYRLQGSNTGGAFTFSNPIHEDANVWVGIPYNMKYTFSEQLFKAKAGNSTSPSNAAKLMIRNGSIYFDETAYFQVKVTPEARNTSVNTFTPDVVGATTIGSLSRDTGFYRFPVFAKAQDTTITIENDSALPSSFQSAEFESFVHSRSNRYG
jgi:hypothetical protein